MTADRLRQIEVDNLSLDDVRAHAAVTELLAEIRRLQAVRTELAACCRAALTHEQARRGQSGTRGHSTLELALAAALDGAAGEED